MHVLHVIPTMGSRDGGPTVAMRMIAAALADQGVKVTVATTRPRGPDVDHVDVAAQTGVEQRVFEESRLRHPHALSWPMLWWLMRDVDQYDLVHVHALFNVQSLTVPRVCRSKRVPYLIRPLGTLDEWSLAHKRWKKLPYYHAVERATLERAAAIHVTSESEAEGVRRLGFGSKVACVPLSVEPPTHTQRAERAADEPLRLLFLSRLHPKKNLTTLLQALQHTEFFARPPQLVIAGDGPSDYVASLRDEVRARNLEDRVRFAGFLTGEAKTKLLLESDLFVLPSFQENFGIAAVEAMAHGLPVVVSEAMSLAKQVASAAAGSVVPTSDPVALAAALAQYQAPALRRAHGEAARALVAREFSTQAMGRQLVRVYERALA